MAVNWDTRSADTCTLPELMGADYCNNCRDYAYCNKKGRFMKQISIFDILERPKENIPCGYLKEEQYYLIGKKISFSQLKDLIGKKVICSVSTESNTWYKVYKVIDYYEDQDKFYKQVRELPENPIGYGQIVNDYIHDVVGIKECMDCYELDFTCDRVALCDSNLNDKANAWVSEAYSNNGRYKVDLDYPETFYELNI